MAFDADCRRRLDAAREYLEQARVADSPNEWGQWALKLLSGLTGLEADALREKCQSVVRE